MGIGVQVLVIVLLGFVQRVHLLVGYNCGRNSPNITTFSLLEVKQCEFEDLKPDVETLDMQLLQKIEYISTYVHQCRIKVNRQIKYCDYRQYASTVEQATYFHVISRETCEDMHRFGRFEYEKLVIRELVANTTNHRSLIIAGTMEENGDCSGTTFITSSKVYKKAVVLVDLEIDLKDSTILANREREELILPSGTRCALEATKCIDAENNYAFWRYQTKAACDFDQFVLLFEGKGVKVGNETLNNPEVYFANSTKEIQFGLSKKNAVTLCGYTIYQTEHPKLYVTEYTPSQGPPVKREIETEDIILTAYFNTKMAYMAHHMKSQFVSLYRDIVTHRCRLERNIIENSLMHISTEPDLAAMRIMKQPGFMAVRAGEVVHIISCEAVQCKVRHISECYQEIPVICENGTYFLKPQSHVMTYAGTPVDCNTLIPTMFRIEQAWHQFTPTISVAKEPRDLEPLSVQNWRYKDIQGLIDSGIYRPKDLEKLNEHILFPAERPALLEEVARKLSDRSVSSISIAKFNNLLDKETIERIAESKLKKVWDGFTQFGIYAAGFMGVVTIFQLIKLVADTIIRGYTIKSVYGWGIHIVGAIWGSLTHLIITKAQTQSQQPPKYELSEVIIRKDGKSRESHLQSKVDNYLEKQRF